MILVILWSALAFAGALVNLALLVDALADLRWLHWSKLNGSRAIVALANIRGALVATVIQFLFLTVGIVLLTGPHAPRQPLTWRAIVFSGMFFTAEILLVGNSGVDWHDRRRLLERVDGKGQA